MSQDDPGQDGSKPADRLSPREQRLVMALLRGDTMTMAAARAGVSIPTAKRWRKRPAVQQALEAAQEESLRELSRLLAACDRDAVATLGQLMRDEATPPATRRASANQLIQRRLQVAVLADLERRLQVLEDSTGEPDADPWRWNG